MDEKKCSKCKANPADENIHSYRPYCSTCWKDINRRKSETMLAANIKRSNTTRAKMAASKRVDKSTDYEKWKLFFDFHLEQLNKADGLRDKIQSLRG